MTTVPGQGLPKSLAMVPYQLDFRLDFSWNFPGCFLDFPYQLDFSWIFPGHVPLITSMQGWAGGS